MCIVWDVGFSGSAKCADLLYVAKLYKHVYSMGLKACGSSQCGDSLKIRLYVAKLYNYACMYIV